MLIVFSDGASFALDPPLGNPIGGTLGGGVVASGLGLPAVALAGAAASASGLALLLWLRWNDRRARLSPRPAV